MYAIAFITDLCHNRDPACFKNANSVELRRHPFSSVPSPKNKPANKKLKIHCSCRLAYVLEYMKPQDVPKGEPTEMIQCNICACWYHHNCVGMTEDEVKKLQRRKEFWMCDVMMLLLIFLKISYCTYYVYDFPFCLSVAINWKY